MKKVRLSRALVLTLVFGLVLTASLLSPVVAMAQGPAGETPTAEPPKPTATEPAPPTATPPPILPTATEPGPGPTPSEPVSIPEPITVILFGTGLAALSAAAAARRKKE